MTVGTLVYLSYGTDPTQLAETRYAVISAWRATYTDDGADIAIVLYTDHPELFADLPVTTRRVTSDELVEWGATGYGHRRKTMVIRDALRNADSPVVFVDSDTWFRRPARKVFERVGPGRSVLHINEGTVDTLDFPATRELGAHVAGRTFHLSGGPITITADAPMWNSGVVGVHPDDAHLIDQALELTDQLWAEHQGSNHLEQFTTGLLLEKHTRVSEVADVVFHYWQAPIREPFQQRLPGLLAATADSSMVIRADELWRDRPRVRGLRRVKVAARRTARVLGRPSGLPRSSAT